VLKLKAEETRERKWLEWARAEKGLTEMSTEKREEKERKRFKKK
jgi:hypothetical protein